VQRIILGVYMVLVYRCHQRCLQGKLCRAKTRTERNSAVSAVRNELPR